VFSQEPEKQFDLVQRHIHKIRQQTVFETSEIIIMVERNLGFEAEHHQRALAGIPLTRHRVDHTAQRYGILTTQDIKLGMMTLLNNMLRDQRVNIHVDLVSDDAKGNRKRLREQLAIYSFQFKSAPDTFGKQRMSLNGKVGGMKDDVCIALQLAIYFSSKEHMYAA
jgi:hypothetical protein